MNILIGCEFSGIVRNAFLKKGHNVWSCDIIPTISKGPHIINDIRNILDYYNWDLMVVFPPCTYLAVSGARWWKYRQQEQKQALKFVELLLNCGIPKIVLENPVGLISTKIRKPDQIIQPYEYSHGEMKKTCLWLKNVPKLVPTDIVMGREQRIWKMSPSSNRSQLRSLTYQGIADAMADQWG